jgi:hypothetical protein
VVVIISRPITGEQVRESNYRNLPRQRKVSDAAMKEASKLRRADNNVATTIDFEKVIYLDPSNAEAKAELVQLKMKLEAQQVSGMSVVRKIYEMDY